MTDDSPPDDTPASAAAADAVPDASLPAGLQKVVDSMTYMRLEGVPFVQNLVNATGGHLHIELRGNVGPARAKVPPAAEGQPATLVPLPGHDGSVRGTLPSWPGEAKDDAAPSAVVNVYGPPPATFRIDVPGANDMWQRRQGIILPLPLAMYLRTRATLVGMAIGAAEARQHGKAALYTVVPTADGDGTVRLVHCGISV